ncbi:MAG: alpha/beta hydrolase [Rhodospirillaceae bacterium]|nr:alpha/beta hydrolase [Rhodospirillaceae bacterium]
MELKVQDKKVFIATGGKRADSSKSTLIMLHGAGMDRTVWSMQARFFAHHGFSVLNPDLPGHGRSEGPAPDSIPAYSAWVLDLLESVGVEEVYLVGHSMGSLIALSCAASLGPKAKKLALLGTLPKIQVHPDLLDSAIKNDHKAYETIVGWGVGRLAQIGGNRTPGSWIAGASMRLLESSPPGVLANDLKACNGWEDGLETATKLKCPTLLLLGSDDRMTPANGVKEMEAVIRDCETVVLTGAGHMMMIEEPEQTLDALIPFFGQAS